MENTNIINATIKSSNIPHNWIYCFNTDCKRREECLRYRATVALGESRIWGNAVYPHALRPDGDAPSSNGCASCVWHGASAACSRT